jgi:hypothetical protein
LHSSLALSANGSTLAVATRIDADQYVEDSVFVFEWTNQQWVEVQVRRYQQ